MDGNRLVDKLSALLPWGSFPWAQGIMDDMTSPMTIPGPRVRDELAGLTSAAAWNSPLPQPLPLGALPWPGEVVRLSDGQGVFVRRTPEAAGIVEPPTAVYVHGLGGSSTNWTALAALLSPQARGLAIDLPGCGRSDPPRGGDYSVRRHVDSIADLLRREQTEPVHLVGNSYGGYLTAILAAAYPELVKSLTLLAPAVPDLRLSRDRGADPRLAMLLAPGMASMAEPRLASISAADRAAGMATLCFGDPSLVGPEDLRAAAGDIAWRHDLPWAHRAMLEQLRGLMKHYLAGKQRPFWRAAAKVKVPTLIVWGTRDKLVDVRLAPQTAAAFQNSKVLILKGVGHVPQMEQPVKTAGAMLSLWASTGASQSPQAERVAPSVR